MHQLTIELRPGEGGDDAYAFCVELKEALIAYARRRGDVVHSHQESRGSRTLEIEVEVEVEGHRHAYDRLAGVHRVQRIPKNDRRGRRHTSTATVAVIEQRAHAARAIDDDDLDVFTYRGSGSGGQHRNKTDTAVRVVHRPTGTTVVVEHGRSQWQNLRQAKTVLAQRLQNAAQRADSEKVRHDRNRQITSGERSVKQFTHNEQRSVVESHQTGEVWRWSEFYRGRLDRRDVA
jgi:protein subunit release factor A